MFLKFLFVLALVTTPIFSAAVAKRAKNVQKRELETVPAEIPEEALMTVPEIIVKHGYPTETHFTTTEDGYILQMNRIPYGIKGSSEDRPALFLMHGLISSSADWILAGPEKGLGYILADKGYDVWMGNARGNKLSRNHTTLDPDNDAKEFWDFDWHQIGVADLPAMIDYVLETTGQKDLYYVGHSQGTTAFYVMAAEKPEYNEKIKVSISMAPIAYMKHMTSPLMQLLSIFEGTLSFLADAIGVNEFLPSNDFMTSFGDIVCSDDSIAQGLCANTLFLICGFDASQFNTSLLPVIMGHTPAGASVKQFMHYAQEINSGYFRQYDHAWDNHNYYDTDSPPKYDLSKVTAPVYLFYSNNDWLSAPVDVTQLYEELGNPQGKLLVTDEEFNHLDYLYAIDAPTLVYNKVISILARY